MGDRSSLRLGGGFLLGGLRVPEAVVAGFGWDLIRPASAERRFGASATSLRLGRNKSLPQPRAWIVPRSSAELATHSSGWIDPCCRSRFPSCRAPRRIALSLSPEPRPSPEAPFSATACSAAHRNDLASPAARPSLGAAAGPGPGPATGASADQLEARLHHSFSLPWASLGWTHGLGAWPGRQLLQGWR